MPPRPTPGEGQGAFEGMPDPKEGMSSKEISEMATRIGKQAGTTPKYDELKVSAAQAELGGGTNKKDAALAKARRDVKAAQERAADKEKADRLQVPKPPVKPQTGRTDKP